MKTYNNIVSLYSWSWYFRLWWAWPHPTKAKQICFVLVFLSLVGMVAPYKNIFQNYK